jgi:hypothetical protein
MKCTKWTQSVTNGYKISQFFSLSNGNCNLLFYEAKFTIPIFTAAEVRTTQKQTSLLHQLRLSFPPAARVTRLGEFSSHEMFFSLGNLYINYANSTNFGAIFFTPKVILLKWSKYCLGHILGDFFHKRIWPPCLQPFFLKTFFRNVKIPNFS